MGALGWEEYIAIYQERKIITLNRIIILFLIAFSSPTQRDAFVIHRRKKARKRQLDSGVILQIVGNARLRERSAGAWCPIRDTRAIRDKTTYEKKERGREGEGRRTKEEKEIGV